MKYQSLKQIKYLTSKTYCRKHHPVHIDYNRVDAQGSPSLCCSVCITDRRKSKYFGKAKYIQFISNRDVEYLVRSGVDIDIRGLG